MSVVIKVFRKLKYIIYHVLLYTQFDIFTVPKIDATMWKKHFTTVADSPGAILTVLYMFYV